MHEIHHSQDVRESRSNLANTFSWWDRLFHTYIDASKVTPETMIFGVEEFRAPKHLALHWMLAQPFLQESAVYEEIRQVEVGDKR
jgi:sterol desaturase/sphingolipid hydroxylase (fatty acid hydroxylase superfamily)